MKMSEFSKAKEAANNLDFLIGFVELVAAKQHLFEFFMAVRFGNPSPSTSHNNHQSIEISNQSSVERTSLGK
jgi:hypothetical protein